MGLFQGKEKPKKKIRMDETTDGVQRFFDGYFQELRNRGDSYFETTIDEHTARFKQDLDITVQKANEDIKRHLERRIDQQIAANDEVIRDVQDAALKNLTASAEELHKQFQQLGDSLKHTMAEHEAALKRVFDENQSRLKTMQDTQETALTSLASSVESLQKQQQEIGATIQKNVEAQQETLVVAFENNMAKIVEHYLLGALGDQYDLKAQLPSIIKQMEDNKDTIVGDMKL